MPTFEIQSPDGKTYEVTAPEGASQHDVLNYVQQQHAAMPPPPATPSGDQPSMIDRAVASPIGRLAHDAIIAPATGLASLAAKGLPVIGGPMLSNAISSLSNMAIEQPYQNSLARNRNTPGYGAALQEAQALQAKRGSGMGDQLTAPFNPAMAGAAGLPGGFDAMNANADAQAQTQGAYAKVNPVKSFAAGFVGGAGMPEGAAASLPAIASSQVAPTIASLNAAKKAAYAVVDNSPMKIAAPEIAQLHSDLQAQLARMGLTEKTLPKLAPKVDAAMDSLKDAAAGDQTLQGMDIQRRIAGIAAGSIDKTERAAARIVQDGIDGLITNLQPSQLSGPIDQAAMDALPKARDLASRSFKAQQLQDIIDKAKNNSTGFAQSGYENALRSGFRKLLNNPRGIARFSPDEVASIKQVATGGSGLSATNLLRQVGKLSPQGAVPILAEAGMYLAGGPGTLAVPAAGIAGRMGATALQKAAAQRAVSLAAMGKQGVAAARALPMPPPIGLPRLPVNGALPYGALNPLLLSQGQNSQ